MTVLIVAIIAIGAITAYVVSFRRYKRKLNEHQADIDPDFEPPTRAGRMVRPSPLAAARDMESDAPIGAGAGFGKYTRETSERRRRAIGGPTLVESDPIVGSHEPPRYWRDPAPSFLAEASNPVTAHGYSGHAHPDSGSSCSPAPDGGHHAHSSLDTAPCPTDTSYGGSDPGGGHHH